MRRRSSRVRAARRPSQMEKMETGAEMGRVCPNAAEIRFVALRAPPRSGEMGR